MIKRFFLKDRLKVLKKLSFILTKSDKQFLLLLLLFSITISIIETIGISAIMPFIALATDFTLIESKGYFKVVYQLIGFSSPIQFVIIFGILLVLFYFIRSGLNILYTYLLNRFAQSRFYSISFRLFKNYMALPYKNFVQENSSNLTKIIMNESSNLTYLVQNALLMLSEIFVLLFLYLMLLYVNYKATIILTILLMVSGLLLLRVVSRRMKHLGEIRAEAQTKFYETLNKSFGNMKLLKLFSNYKMTFQEFEKSSLFLVKSNIEAATLTQLPKLVLEAVGFSLIIIVVVYLVWSTQDNIASTIAVLSIYVLALYRLLPSVSRIMSSYHTIVFYYQALEIIYKEILKEAEDLGTESIRFDQLIELKNISFEYEKNKIVLDSISLSIKQGEKIAFIGESGSGKSTIVDVIMGLSMPTQGEILIDCNLLNNANLVSWRKKIGYIPQQVYLFDGTIADNIVFGSKYDEEKIIKVLKQAQIYNFLETKDGLNTEVGEGGLLLSGGQKQRIAIARALYTNPEVLVLDEATSALDEATEKKIMEEVYSVSKDLTLIVIAHRLSTIKQCDKVYKLCKGKLSE